MTSTYVSLKTSNSQLGNDIPAVQQVARQRVPRQLRRADAIGIVGKRRGHVVHRLGGQLVESIIPVIRRRRNMILRPPLSGGEQVACGVVGVVRALRGAARVQAGDQPVVGIVVVADGVVLRARDGHAGAVTSRVKGITHRQAALLAFAGQTPQAVIFISRDHAVLVGLACLISRRIIGVVEGRKRSSVLRVCQARNPVCGVVGVGGGDAVGQRHARAVAVDVVLSYLLRFATL